jgi:hypothetical protein
VRVLNYDVSHLKAGSRMHLKATQRGQIHVSPPHKRECWNNEACQGWYHSETLIQDTYKKDLLSKGYLGGYKPIQKHWASKEARLGHTQEVLTIYI